MISNSMVWSTLLLAMLLIGSSQRHQTLARSAEGLARIEKLLSSSSSGPSLSAQSPSSPLAALRSHSLPKRAVLDQSCKGIYDRELFKKLDRVCEDCFNLYRKPYVGIDCRANCYSNLVFRQCLDDLLLMENLDEYVTAVQMVGK